jgi:serine/threonine protein kinase
MLNLELTIIEALQKRAFDGFTLLKDSGLNQETPFLVINRFGRTLQDIMDRRCSLFSLKTVVQIAIQLTTLLERFHSLGLVYNDLKPDNICVGNYDSKEQVTNQHAIFLIDYGLASRYRVKGSNSSKPAHVRQKTEGFKGNYAYASQNALNLQTTSRRDDILSLLFLVYYMLTGDVFGKPVLASRVAILRTRYQYDEKNLEDA